MSEVRVNKLSPRSGTTVTLGDSGDTITIPSGVTFDASSGGLAGTLTTAAQPNITSVGTLTGFTSTGIDDNATSTAITIDSSENVGIGTSSPNLHGWTKAVTLDTSSNGAYELGQSGTKYGAFALQGDGRVELTNFTSNPVVIRTVNTERMRIDSSGQVGIGTSSPSAALDVVSAADALNFKFENTSHNAIMEIKATTANKNSIIRFADSASSTIGDIDYDHNDNSLSFTTNASERMRIDSSGNVGIGTTSPTQPLQVEGIALSKPVIGMYSINGTDNADRDRAIQSIWRASSDRGAWSISGTGSGTRYVGMSTSSNNSYIVWDLILTNCKEIDVDIKYSNSADASTRSAHTQYSVDGGSNWTTLASTTFGAGIGDAGGLISFSDANFQNQIYLKVRTAFTSGAGSLNSTLRIYVGLRTVLFTPHCSSVGYSKSLG